MIRSLILTLQFLTRLPLPIPIDFNRKTLARGTVFYPFVGMLIGGIASGAYYLFDFISHDAAALGAVFAIIAVTGGLHVDGLADTADGFFSSRPRDKILEIMKDSRVGAFGVIAIVFDILAKYVLLKEFTITGAANALVLSCGLSRTAAAMLFSFGKSARPGGLGDQVTNNHSRVYFMIGTGLFAVVGFGMSNLGFLIAAAAVLMFSILLMMYANRVIGGLTGDVYGAVCELGEIIGLCMFVAVRSWI